jgi:hypothetical protein
MTIESWPAGRDHVNRTSALMIHCYTRGPIATLKDDIELLQRDLRRWTRFTECGDTYFTILVITDEPLHQFERRARPIIDTIPEISAAWFRRTMLPEGVVAETGAIEPNAWKPHAGLSLVHRAPGPPGRASAAPAGPRIGRLRMRRRTAAPARRSSLGML